MLLEEHCPTQGLIFSKDRGEGWAQEDGAGLEVFTDVSFAPAGWGTASHGCAMVFWNKALLFWRSGRQGFPTLSTAEAELVETIEGITLGDSVEALLKEHESWSYRRSLFTDNQATVALLEGTATGWRTRHLRLRACEVEACEFGVASASSSRQHHASRLGHEGATCSAL